jgi:hypothetical protein
LVFDHVPTRCNRAFERQLFGNSRNFEVDFVHFLFVCFTLKF